VLCDNFEHVFNKVVWWHRLGEVGSVYVAYNFSHFAIYLAKFIKICGNCQSSSKNKNAQLF